MSGYPLIRHASPFTWAGRAVLALSALAAAYFAGAQSLATAMGRGHEGQAYALAPWDAQITGRYARSIISAAPGPSASSRAHVLARKALTHEATAIDAIVALGIEAQLRGDVGTARTFFGFAKILSRRDLQTQLWLIEDAVSRGDVPHALQQYDITLRTSKSARDILFPILTSAIADPAITDATARTLARKPRWTPDFIYYVAKQGTDPVAVAGLFARLRRLGVPVSDAANAALIEELIGKRLYLQAWSVYAGSRSGSSRLRSRDPHFANNQGSRSAFDWQLFSDDGVSTAIERGDNGNVLTFSTTSGAAGLLARQLQLLPSGSYVVGGRSAKIDLPQEARPFVQLNCLDGRPLGKSDLPNSNQHGGAFQVHLIVPKDCPVQFLSLIARPYDMGSRIEGEVSEIALLPAR
jgi:hypothetical protein